MKPIPPSRQIKVPGWAHTDVFRNVMSQVAASLSRKALHIPEARVESPRGEAHEPEFYVAALRVPGDEGSGLRPAMLVYVLSPSWFVKEPSGQITFVAAIGPTAAVLSIRRFLRAWQHGRLGGEVIYDGDLCEGPVEERTAESVDRFVERRGMIDAEQRGLGTISVWPVTGSAPRFCVYCLIPAGQGVCPRCGGSVAAGSHSWPRAGRQGTGRRPPGPTGG